ncbi:MAG: ABC transporter substrate-binding protein, partial [Candidatus Binatia bacterium]
MVRKFSAILAPALTAIAAALTAHCAATPALAAEKLIGIHSARVMSQSMPWIAQEAGLFKKHNLEFQLVFIASSNMVTAAMLGGDAEMSLTGAVGNVRAYVQGATDLVFIGGVKNVMTQSILAGGNLKKPEDLKGKQIGVSRLGSNTHYFTIQALRRAGMEPNRDFSFLQTGGDPESLAALLNKKIDVVTLTAPSDAIALAKGYHYVVYGPDLRIPYAATAFVSKRSVMGKRPQVVGQFMRSMAEAAKILHTDREFTYKVLGKYLRLTDRSILEAAYNGEIKALEPRLVIKSEALQA